MRGMKVSTSSICAASSISTLSYCKREERGAEEEEEEGEGGGGEATSISTMCESVCGGRCSDLECKLHKVPSLERSVCAGHCNDLGFFYQQIVDAVPSTAQELKCTKFLKGEEGKKGEHGGEGGRGEEEKVEWVSGEGGEGKRVGGDETDWKKVTTHLQLLEHLPDVSEASLYGGRQHGLNSEYNGTKLRLLYLSNIPVLLEALSLEDWLRGIGKVLGERKQLSYCSHSIVRLK